MQSKKKYSLVSVIEPQENTGFQKCIGRKEGRKGGREGRNIGFLFMIKMALLEQQNTQKIILYYILGIVFNILLKY